MAITFKVNSTTGEGTFIRVLRDGRHSGRCSTPLVSTGSTKVTTKSWAARSSKTRISSGSRRRSNRRMKDEDDDRRHLRPQVDRRRTVMRGSLVQRLQGQLEHCPRSQLPGGSGHGYPEAETAVDHNPRDPARRREQARRSPPRRPARRARQAPQADLRRVAGRVAREGDQAAARTPQAYETPTRHRRASSTAT